MNQTIRIITVLLALGCWHPALAQTHFTEVGAQAGVADSVGINAMVAWGDYDNDGFLDLYVTNWGIYVKSFTTQEGLSVSDSIIAVPNRLYHNQGDGTFADLATTAGVIDPQPLPAVNGPAWGDYDNDGDLDLFVSGGGGPPGRSFVSCLYWNRGNGTFTETAASAGVDNKDIIGTGGVWGDFDSDGWLDLYVCNIPYFDAEGNHDLSKSIPSQLYRNNKDGTFTDVAAQAGVNEYGYYPLSVDYNNDGLLDLYLPSPYFFPNPSRLYRNNGEGTFTDMAASAKVGDLNEVQILSAAWGDYDNDGWVDLYKVNNNAANKFLRNKGDGTFTDKTEEAGTADDKIGFGNGASWADFDNDGFLDLFVTNLASSSPCRLFHHNGNGTFADVGIDAGVNTPDGGGAAWGDYDNDGFLDLFVAVYHFADYDLQVGGPNLLFHNQGNANHWLGLQLKGTISNRDAIGAKVVAVTGKTRQRRDVESAGSGWGSQPSLPVEFGFGSAAVVDSLIIRWPSGIVQVMTQVPTDQYLTLAESSGPAPTAVLEEQLTALPAALSLSQNYPNPFNSATVIRFALPASGEVELGVYDLVGQRVALLVSGNREAGSYAVSWDGRDERGRELASGTYLYRLRAGGREETRKLALVR